MNAERRHIINAGENYRKKVLEPEVRDGKRCKSCYTPIRDEKTWYNGTQLCQGCKDAMEFGISWH